MMRQLGIEKRHLLAIFVCGFGWPFAATGAAWFIKALSQ